MMTSLSKEEEIPVEVIAVILKWFFIGLRRVMIKNIDVNLFGLFKIKMKRYYRRKLEQNPKYNVRKRFNKKKHKQTS